MGDKTGISWTDATWNPVVGCSIVSPGCKNCYAMKIAHKMLDKPGSHYEGTTKKVNGNAVWTGKMNLAPQNILERPLRWKKPRKIFVNSMSDLFHENVPDEWIAKVFAVMSLARGHTFQILTKRAQRMYEYISARPNFPILPNVWLGVSAEDEERYIERVYWLRKTPAAIRFISAEPLIGPLMPHSGAPYSHWFSNIDWVIVGGESGPDFRPMELQWAADIMAACKNTNTAFFMKQIAALKSGGAPPAQLQINQFPKPVPTPPTGEQNAFSL